MSTPATPEEVAHVRRNVVFYRAMAYVTGVVLVILCVTALLQLAIGDGAVVNVLGQVHGVLYIIYLAAAYLLARRLRLAAGPTVLMLLAGTVPVLTFVVERQVTHRYLEPALAAGGPAAAPAPAAAPPPAG
jgi:integral membrane protein